LCETKTVKMTVAPQRKMNWRNFLICLSISLGQIAFGYPSSIIGTTLGQPAFLEYMGLITPLGHPAHNMNNLIGATSGVFQVSFSTELLNFRIWADHPFLGWSFLWHFGRQFRNGQMGQKGWCHILLYVISIWWCLDMRQPKHWHVHRIPILRRCWKLGVLGSE